MLFDSSWSCFAQLGRRVGISTQRVKSLTAAVRLGGYLERCGRVAQQQQQVDDSGGDKEACRVMAVLEV